MNDLINLIALYWHLALALAATLAVVFAGLCCWAMWLAALDRRARLIAAVRDAPQVPSGDELRAWYEAAGVEDGDR